MFPEKGDSRWQEVVTSGIDYPLSGLASKMLLMRVRLMVKLDQSPEKVSEAISITYDFFSKNKEILKNDLEILFGKE